MRMSAIRLRTSASASPSLAQHAHRPGREAASSSVAHLVRLGMRAARCRLRADAAIAAMLLQHVQLDTRRGRRQRRAAAGNADQGGVELKGGRGAEAHGGSPGEEAGRPAMPKARAAGLGVIERGGIDRARAPASRRQRDA